MLFLPANQTSISVQPVSQNFEDFRRGRNGDPDRMTLGSIGTQVKLLRPWMRRFTMNISAW